MRLALYSPQWDRPCGVCKKYLYDNDTGCVRRHPHGEPIPLGRMPTPCMQCPKPPLWAIKQGLPVIQLQKLAEPLEMTEQNREAFAAYRRFRAVGRFPEDEIVEWYAGIIGDEYDTRNSQQSRRIGSAAQTVVEILKKRWGASGG